MPPNVLATNGKDGGGEGSREEEDIQGAGQHRAECEGGPGPRTDRWVNGGPEKGRGLVNVTVWKSDTRTWVCCLLE